MKLAMIKEVLLLRAFSAAFTLKIIRLTESHVRMGSVNWPALAEWASSASKELAMARTRRQSSIKGISIQKTWLQVPARGQAHLVTQAISMAFRPSWARSLALGAANWPAMERLNRYDS